MDFNDMINNQGYTEALDEILKDKEAFHKMIFTNPEWKVAMVNQINTVVPHWVDNCIVDAVDINDPFFFMLYIKEECKDSISSVEIIDYITGLIKNTLITPTRELTDLGRNLVQYKIVTVTRSYIPAYEWLIDYLNMPYKLSAMFKLLMLNGVVVKVDFV